MSVKKVCLAFVLSLAAAAVWYGYVKNRAQETPLPVPAIDEHPFQDLQEIWEQARKQHELSSSAMGFCVLDEQGKVLFGKNETTAFIPASTLKTVTTATALEKLGPEFCFKTLLRATSPIHEGVLQGDLVLEGGGDPMLSLTDLETLAAKLKAQGLLRIQGRIIGDGRLIKGSIYDDFWNWGDIGNGYGSPVCGLNLEHNRFTAGFQAAAAAGQRATFLGTVPEVPDVEWISEVVTSAATSGDGVVIHGGERTHRMYLRGTVPLGERPFTVTGAVPDPELYAAHHLRSMITQASIEVTGEAVTATGIEVPPAPVVLLEHASPPLKEIITSIHATSDNHETECIYRLLGRLESKEPDTVIREHWRTRGLIFEGLRMEDGCGLARADFIRPLDLARLQSWAGSGPQGEAYRFSLPATADGRVRWKGGAMSGVRSYTGFVQTSSGQTWTFALMVNHFTDGNSIAGLRDELLHALQRR